MIIEINYDSTVHYLYQIMLNIGILVECCCCWLSRLLVYIVLAKIGGQLLDSGHECLILQSKLSYND